MEEALEKQEKTEISETKTNLDNSVAITEDDSVDNTLGDQEKNRGWFPSSEEWITEESSRQDEELKENSPQRNSGDENVDHSEKKKQYQRKFEERNWKHKQKEYPYEHPNSKRGRYNNYQSSHRKYNTEPTMSAEEQLTQSVNLSSAMLLTTLANSLSTKSNSLLPQRFQPRSFTGGKKQIQVDENFQLDSKLVDALKSGESGTETVQEQKPASNVLSDEQVKILEEAQRLLISKNKPASPPHQATPLPPKSVPFQPIAQPPPVQLPIPQPIQIQSPSVVQIPQVTPEEESIEQDNFINFPLSLFGHSDSKPKNLPIDLLFRLSDVLQDPTIFEIVKSLQQIQLLKAKELQKRRIDIRTQHKAQRDQLLQLHRAKLKEATAATWSLISQQNLETLRYQEETFRKELEEFDRRAYTELAEKLSEQQMILQQAGVPGFYSTFNAEEVEIQSQIISTIQGVAREMEKQTQNAPPTKVMNPPINHSILQTPMTMSMVPIQQPQFIQQVPLMQQPTIIEQPNTQNLLSGLDPNQLARLLGQGHFRM